PGLNLVDRNDAQRAYGPPRSLLRYESIVESQGLRAAVSRLGGTPMLYGRLRVSCSGETHSACSAWDRARAVGVQQHRTSFSFASKNRATYSRSLSGAWPAVAQCSR